MSLLTTPLSIVGLFSVLFMLFILANLSRRLGAVTKMKPYYRGFYAAMAILSAPIIARMIYGSAALSDQGGSSWLRSATLHMLTYHLPLALAVTLSLVIAWRYWGWLFREPPS